MNRNFPNKKNRICNLLADFIVLKIGKEFSSRIQVTDCINFYVLNGKTNSSTILDMNQIIEEFNEKFKDFLDDEKVSRTIDLIEYSKDLNLPRNLSYTFFDTENNMYNNKYDYTNQMEGFVVSSEFPFGYSIDMGRNMFYNLKHIAYNVTKIGYIKWINLDLNLDKDGDDIINVICSHSDKLNDVLKSAILDVFDLESMVKYDFSNDEIFNETLAYEKDQDLLKITNPDFIIF
jgi:hypothetical protein